MKTNIVNIVVLSSSSDIRSGAKASANRAPKTIRNYKIGLVLRKIHR